jgi:hypothetical protein
MVKLKSPMMSLDASGSIGSAITFSKWKGRNYARKLVVPANPQSGLQTGMRAGMSYLSKNYASLTAGEKTAWEAHVASLSISGINGYIRHNQARLRRNLGVQSAYNDTAAAAIAAPTGGAAAAAPKSVVLTWVDSAGTDHKATAIYWSLTGTFTRDISKLVAIIPDGVQTYTDIRLTTGVARFYEFAAVADTGTLGTASAEVTATPT